MSNLYKFQEWLESVVSAVLPAGVEVICRRKGDVDSDIANALASMGLSVVIEPPLPLRWGDTVVLDIPEAESEIHIIENVLLDASEETAYSLLETIARTIHDCGGNPETGTSYLKLGAVRDESPADEPIIHFVLPITNAVKI